MKIEFNWKLGILLTLISFIVFIIYMAFFRSKISSQLISDNYYEEEIKYQNIINERNNTNNLNKKIFIKILPIGIKIFFPKIFKSNNTIGKFQLLRPSNKYLDINKYINLNISSEEIIPAINLKKGLYILIIKWESNNKKYFFKQPVIWIQ